MNFQRILRCTAFEELMLSQDSPEYPCVICVRLQVIGKIERAYFEEAVRRLVDRHPLLRGRLRPRFGKSNWLIDHEGYPTVQWLESATVPDWPQVMQFDLAQGAGLSIEVIESTAAPLQPQSEVRSAIFFQVHHAIADGLGCLEAIHDLLLIYDALCRDVAPPLSEVDTSLCSRNRFVASWQKLWELLPRQLVGLAGIRQFVMRQPVPVVEPFPGVSTGKQEGISAISCRFSVELTAGLKSSAIAQQVTLNELLAGGIFQGCCEFRSSRQPALDTDWLRMMVPVNMRDPRARLKQTACNIVSCAFLDRTPQQILEPHTLLQGIHQEMELIKNNKLGLIFIFSIWMRKHFKLMPGKRKSPSRCETSMVFTNLGKLFSRSPLLDSQQRLTVGTLQVEGCEGLAPLTRFMCVAFTTAIYARQQTLSMRYDPAVMDAAMAQQLFDATLKYIERSIEELGGACT